MVAGAVKLTSDLNLSWRSWGALIRGTAFYDQVNSDFDESHPDRTFQPGKTNRPSVVEDRIGYKAEFLDYYVFGQVPLWGERSMTVRLGDQVVNWGESTFLVANSINSSNAPNLARFRAPAFDIKELFEPAGMLFIGTELLPSLSFEGFYAYEWKPAVPDPVGSFWSTSDTAGEGGTYAMLSFSKAPEDPTQSYDPKTNADPVALLSGGETDRTGLFSSSSRTILRGPDRKPDDGGEYGLKLSYFAESFNGGTEFAAYHMNYHSKLPIASLRAANATCVGESSTTATQAILDCGGILLGPIGALGFGEEPLPVETAQVFLEYPKDIRLYGTSFNTTIGDWAWSGEIAYRPNQPLQVHSTDLTLAAVNPAFPANDIPICVGGLIPIPGLPIPGIGNCGGPQPIVAVIPGRRSGAPDFVMTRYRNNPVDPGEYIRGYESMKVANIGTTFLNTIGGDNPFKADQVLWVFELGGTKVFDMPGLDELQFNAAGADTHASDGADGTSNIGLSELGPGCLAQDTDAGPTAADTQSRACRQNPTAEDPDAFPDDFSWGFRTVMSIRYQDLLYGVNVEPLFGVFKDVDGIAPGPGENFIEGRETYLLGVNWDYLNQWSGGVRYTGESGGRINNPRLDRDYVLVNVRYEF